MPQHEGALIIRTHDRSSFLDCRQAWDWGSKIRTNLEPNRGDTNMDFGTAIHRGMEEIYQPHLWGVASDEARLALALDAFDNSWRSFQPQYTYDEEIALWHELHDLGKIMLTRYMKWAAKADDFTPTHVEIEFEVPVLASPELAERINAYEIDSLYVQFKCIGENRHLHARRGESEEWVPVYYQGRIDMLCKDKHGFYYIVDHKTAGKLDPTDHLEMDEQTGSYCWAVGHLLGLPIRGVIYNELVKSFPKPPKQLKSGKFSQDKSQNTTVEIFEETLAQHGQTVVEYTDFLDWLRDNERPYFRRTQVPRSHRELVLLGERICVEAIDMLNDPSIYPAPNRFKCGRCKFRSACLAKMDGSDFSFILGEDFHVRE